MQITCIWFENTAGGRLKGIKEFTKLSRGQAQKLAGEINSDREVTSPMPEAEVC